MKILYVVETFTAGLGYIDNVLPFKLAEAGHDVEIITCGLPPYFSDSSSHFGDLSANLAQPGVRTERGVTIRTLPHRRLFGRLLMKGLAAALRSAQPDVVIVRALASPVLAQVALSKIEIGFDIVTSTGQTFNAVPEKVRLGRWNSKPRVFHWMSRTLPGRVLHQFVAACVGSTESCVRAAVEFYGVPSEKARVISLGVDSENFHPVSSSADLEDRSTLRMQLGFTPSDLVCIWTGRMTLEKAAPLLAQATQELRGKGLRVRALFVGSGPAEDELRAYPDVVVEKFVRWRDLPRYYRASDIAVWPRYMTTSMLDASACGLPVILSGAEPDSSRWRDIGATYEEGEQRSLEEAICRFTDVELRAATGRRAAAVMKGSDWSCIAQEFSRLFREIKCNA